ncbi:MAG TPA: beta-ketoacyl synthase N-terminal-like domain-containing protein [Polyangiaceae bacterium]|nr:beta-ketoacyl synthase N-terminal-like domain-containing protein [Polyangiaceae bacterium]
MAAAVVAFGAASALGQAEAAFDVGEPGAQPRDVWSSRAGGKPFGRVLSCAASPAERPRALLELGFDQVVERLGVWDPEWRRLRLGVIVGTSSGGFAALERALGAAAAGAPASAEWARSPYFDPLSGALPRLGRERAPERLVSLYAACASSTLALGLGLRWLELGEVELVIAGGYDAESAWVGAGFDALKATSSGVPRPFRAERDGMALGEGVALLALTRGSEKSYGFLLGFCATSDAVHITAPDRTGRSLARAAQGALSDAGLGTSALGFVSVHGTGTSFNDAAEAAALGLVFGARAASLELHAFKSVVGHTLGAAGALESLSALSALARGVFPASASPGTPMPELPARLLDKNSAGLAEHCLKLSTAFGGSNAALVLSRRAAPLALRAPRPVYVVAAGSVCTALDVSRVIELMTAPAERLPRSDVLSELAVAAGAEALRDARARGVSFEPARTGVIVGSVGATLEADAAFGTRILAKGVEHAEPRRFPGTSPNACAGHVAIAFGLGGLSHAVGAGAGAAVEALEVARDWLAAGDLDAVLVVGAEQAGPTASRALGAAGLLPPAQGSFALLLSTTGPGPVFDLALLENARRWSRLPENTGFRALEAVSLAVGLPGPGGFGTVRPPE